MSTSKIVAGALKAVSKKPMTISQLAAKLGVTAEGVRVQLPKLKKVKGLKVELTSALRG